MADFEWSEERAGDVRRFKLDRPSGYTATVAVQGDRVSAELGKANAAEKTFEEASHVARDGDVEAEIARSRREIEQRLSTLESGHS